MGNYSEYTDWDYVCSDIRRVLNEHMSDFTVQKCLMDKFRVFVTGTSITTNKEVHFKVFYAGGSYEVMNFNAGVSRDVMFEIERALQQRGNPKNRKGGI